MKKLIVLVVFSVFCFRAFSFTLSSSSNPGMQGWASSDVKIYVNTANCPLGVDVVALIEDAASVWNNLPNSSIKVSYGGSTSSTAMSNPPIVYCETNFSSIADEDFVPGAASSDASSGQITRGIIYLNASTGFANIANFDSETLKIIIAHEMGHLLGLGHSNSSSALMYFDASYKQEFRLSQDDIDGMTYLYPDDNLDASGLVGCGLVTGGFDNDNINMKAFLICLMFIPLMIAMMLRFSPGFI